MGTSSTFEATTTNSWKPPKHYSFTPTSVDSGHFWWKVRGKNDCGNYGDWSPTYHFYVKTYNCSHTNISSAHPGTNRGTYGIGIDIVDRKAYITNNSYEFLPSGFYNIWPTNQTYFYKYNMDSTMTFNATYGGEIHDTGTQSFLNVNVWGARSSYCGGSQPLGLTPDTCIDGSISGVTDDLPRFITRTCDLNVSNGNIYIAHSVFDVWDGNRNHGIFDFCNPFGCDSETITSQGLWHQKIVKYDTNGNFIENIAFGPGGEDIDLYDCTPTKISDIRIEPNWRSAYSCIDGLFIDQVNNTIYVAQIDIVEHIKYDNFLACSGTSTVKYNTHTKQIPLSGGAYLTNYIHPNSGTYWMGSSFGIVVDTTNNILFTGIWNMSLGQYFVEAYNSTTEADLGKVTVSGHTFGTEIGLDIIQTNGGNYLVTTDRYNTSVMIWKYDPSNPTNATLLKPKLSSCSGMQPYHIEVDDLNTLSDDDKYDLYIANGDGRVFRFNSIP